MNKNVGTIALLVGLVFLALGVGYFRFVIGPKINQAIVPLATPNVQTQPVADDTQHATASAEVMGIIGEMNPRQRVAQLLAFPVITVNSSSPVASASSNWVKGEQPGFVTIFGNRISSNSAKLAVNELKTISSSSVPLAIAVDHEGGAVQRLNGTGFTVLPDWKDACALPESDRTLQLQRSAVELGSVGINIVFGPVTDTVATSSALMAERSCGSNFEANQAAVRSFIDIFAFQKVGSVLKHYPNLGSLTSDLHEKFATVSATPESFTQLEKEVGETKALGIMTSHPGTPLDPGVPCSQSGQCLKSLRSSTAKLLFSDGLEMTAAQYRSDGTTADPLAIAIEALNAGNDVLVYGPQPNRFFTLLLDGLELSYSSDPTFQKTIDKHLERVIEYKLQLR